MPGRSNRTDEDPGCPQGAGPKDNLTIDDLPCNVLIAYERTWTPPVCQAFNS